MFESYYASRPTPESSALLERVRAAGRAENRAAAQRLVAIGELFVLRCRDSGERADWAMDTWEAVAAQVGAALNCSVAMGSSYLRYAVALRDRLPQVGEAFLAGDLDYRAFQTIVFRTELITDPEVLARVDRRLAVRLSRCPSLTRGRLAAVVDQVVARVDGDAVRRSAKALRDRYLDVVANESGMAYVSGNVAATAGRALDLRLDELAGTVCDEDPRSREQRRADAVAALAAGADRLACGCGSSRCAGVPAPKTNVVIHVVAEAPSVAGTGSAPGVLVGGEDLVPAEQLGELAGSARLVPVRPPAEASEPRYVPSAGLADFVRCRDLTCRAPGCDRPAVVCDVDHTVAYVDGGPTHASNLKCLCRKHHLLKTFWGWRDRQLPDGTVIWELPDGQTYVTTPGSVLLFPQLCEPTPGPRPVTSGRTDPCPHRGAMMPTRTHTRRHDRATRIAAERRQNHLDRQARQALSATGPTTPTTATDSDPPPF